MPTVKRVFLIVLDSFGIGALPDAASYGDEGSNTLKACFDTGVLAVPNLTRLGLFNLDGVTFGTPVARPAGAFARLAEQSAGKDTTIGHWEIAGLISPQAMPTYPNGFPKEIIAAFEQRTGRGTLCNRPYSGTQVLEDFGAEHLATGKLIVYTSADSVFQLAAHESIVPVEQLYTYCQIARDLLQGEHAVGRVHRPSVRRRARPVQAPPPGATIFHCSHRARRSSRPAAGSLQTISIGKISDIFAGQGISRSLPTVSNEDGMDKLLAIAEEDWHWALFCQSGRIRHGLRPSQRCGWLCPSSQSFRPKTG